MSKQTKAQSARERILKKAGDLFYRQGYQATGINQIIKESQVAKQTFYDHFPSKDDLCVAYLRSASADEMMFIGKEIAKRKTPLAKFMCLIEELEPWMRDNHMRGCNFLNIIPEVTDPASPIRKAGVDHYRAHGKNLKRLAEQLVASDRKKYGHLKVEWLVRQYLTIVAGSMSLSGLYHRIGPMQDGIRMIRELVA
jgi:AcrR family transcriptional regulator